MSAAVRRQAATGWPSGAKSALINRPAAWSNQLCRSALRPIQECSVRRNARSTMQEVWDGFSSRAANFMHLPAGIAVGQPAHFCCSQSGKSVARPESLPRSAPPSDDTARSWLRCLVRFKRSLARIDLAFILKAVNGHHSIGAAISEVIARQEPEASLEDELRQMTGS